MTMDSFVCVGWSALATLILTDSLAPVQEDFR